MNTQENTAHPASLLSAILVAIWLLTQTFASAIEVTGPGPRSGVPAITSYAPLFAAVGEKVLANIDYINVPREVAVSVIAIELPSETGFIRVPVTLESQRSIGFVVPAGAVSGQPFLIGTGDRRRVQPAFEVVPFSLRARGVTIINDTQYPVGSVKSAGTELLPAGVTIGLGNAGFISMNVTTQTKLLDIGLVKLNDDGSMLPLFNLQEGVQVAPVRPGTTLTLQVRTTLELQRLTLAEALGAVNESVEWRITQRGLNRRMIVFPGGEVVLEERQGDSRPISAVFHLEEVLWGGNSGHIIFTLRNGNERIGELISMPAPFDVFAANKLGFFRNDQGQITQVGTPVPEGYVGAPVPMLVRRLR